MNAIRYSKTYFFVGLKNSVELEWDNVKYYVVQC